MIKILKSLMIVSIVMVITLPGLGQSSVSYDEHIRKITRKLVQYPGRTKELPALKENFDAAHQADLMRIRQLLATGQPDIWVEIYQRYQKMDARQNLIGQLPEKTVRQAGIVLIDFKTDMLEAKYTATAYHYAHAEKLLETGQPEAARQAYRDLRITASLNPAYRELDRLIRRSVLLGATQIGFEMHNRTGKPVSNSIIDHLTRVIWEFKKARHGNVETQPEGQEMRFSIRVVLNELQVGPDQMRELQYLEERDQFMDDVVVDTLRCEIQEYRQLKKASMIGALEYFDHQAGQVINTVPIKVESLFTNAYASLQGDPQAAGDATRLLLSSKRAAYPSNEQMVLDAAEEFAKKASEVILAQ